MAAPTTMPSGGQDLKKADITELKAMSNPPQDVKTVLTEVTVLLGHPRKAMTWAAIKKLLGHVSFLKSLAELEASHINPAVAQDVKAHLKDLSVEHVMKVNRACASLLAWANYTVEEAEKTAGSAAGEGQKLATN